MRHKHLAREVAELRDYARRLTEHATSLATRIDAMAWSGHESEKVRLAVREQARHCAVAADDITAAADALEAHATFEAK